MTDAMQAQMLTRLAAQDKSSSSGWQMCYSSLWGDSKGAPEGWHSRCDSHPHDFAVANITSYGGRVFGGCIDVAMNMGKCPL
jgi:hypothetical protein